jgi:hypothetical protein
MQVKNQIVENPIDQKHKIQSIILVFALAMQIIGLFPLNYD